jgi:hypothetical protein
MTAPSVSRQYDPLQIFMTADGFFLASMVLAQEANKVLEEAGRTGSPPLMHLPAPQAVCSAFCTELFLKCLESLDYNRDPARGHNLKKLFHGLLPTSQSLAKNYFDVYAAQDPAWVCMKSRIESKVPGVVVDLDYCLDQCATAFGEFRYAYEGSTASNLLHPFNQALRWTILERHPEWFSSAVHFGEPPIPSSVAESCSRQWHSKNASRN